MSLFRWPELLRAPEGEGGATPPAVTIVAEPAPIVAVAPLTVDPGSTTQADGGAAAPPAAETPIAPAAGAELDAGAQGLLAGAKSVAEIKAAPAVAAPAPSLPAPAEGGEPVVGAAPAKPAPVEPQPKAKEPTSYQEFKLPKGVTAVSPDGIKRFTDILNSDPENSQTSQKVAQALFELHATEVVRHVDDQKRGDRAFWTNLNEGWMKECREDPVLSKSLEYNLAIGKAVIEQYSRSPKDAAAILQQIVLNGMTNFPPFLRLMHNLGSSEVLNVLEDGIVPPLAPVNAAVRSRADKWYGANGAASDGMTPKA